MKKQITLTPAEHASARAIMNALAMCDELRDLLQKMKEDGLSQKQMQRMCKQFIAEVYGEQAATEAAGEDGR